VQTSTNEMVRWFHARKTADGAVQLSRIRLVAAANGMPFGRPEFVLSPYLIIPSRRDFLPSKLRAHKILRTLDW
jgi:hypothetical protein